MEKKVHKHKKYPEKANVWRQAARGSSSGDGSGNRDGLKMGVMSLLGTMEMVYDWIVLMIVQPSTFTKNH